MKTVLISFSFSPQSKNMVMAAVNFAKTIGADMQFCHVAEDHVETRRKINLFLENADVVNGQVTIRPGNPDKVIRRVAKEIKADLIIAGALEHESTFVGIFGSVARRIVRKAPCSVLLLTPAFLSDGVPFQKMLISVAYDAKSRAMTEWVIDAARQLKASMRVVHLYDFCLRFLELEEVGDERRIHEYTQECAAVESQRLKHFIEGFNWQGLGVRSECLKGGDLSELTLYIQKMGADLAVLPAPKRIRFWQRFFNPPAEVVLQDLPCSILFYRGRPA